jgi:hypothetical protein
VRLPTWTTRAAAALATAVCLAALVWLAYEALRAFLALVMWALVGLAVMAAGLDPTAIGTSGYPLHSPR